MNAKSFKEKLQSELNALGFPVDEYERKRAFAKVFNLSKHTASSILNGMMLPDRATLEKIAVELDVSFSWLLGDSEVKRNEPVKD